MRASIGKIDITPNEPSYLCGHAIRTDLSKGVMDPLYVTILLLDDEKKKSVFVSYDLIMLDRELTDLIIQKVSKAIDCPEENVIVSFIHTHSAPEVSEESVFSDSDKGARPGFRDSLVLAAEQCARNIANNLQEVDIYYASTKVDGYYSNRNDKNKKTDKSVNFVKFVANNETLAMLVNMNCHPTVLGPQNHYISADLFGAIRTQMANKNRCEVFMMQGAAGDVSNRQYRQGNDKAELIRMSNGIVEQLNKEFVWEYLDVKDIKFHKTDYHVKYELDMDELKQRLEINQKQLATATDENQIKLWSSGVKMLESVISQGSHVDLNFHGNIIQFGKCIFICIPGELFNQLGEQIKRAFPEYYVMIWGYCEELLGYLVEEAEYGKSYESIATQIKKGIPEKYIEYLIKETRRVIKENGAI